jgi:hypothetical protein
MTDLEAIKDSIEESMRRWEHIRQPYRGAQTELRKAGHWNVDWIMKEYTLIEKKQSGEQRAARDLVCYIVNNAFLWVKRPAPLEPTQVEMIDCSGVEIR